MIDNTEFSELILIWDVHEQASAKSRTRVDRIVTWFKSRGGMIQKMELPRCDYHIGGGYDEDTKIFLPGIFRGKDINLGIEYKTFEDFNNSKDDLSWKLFEAGKIYDAVALFVQENNFSLSFTENGTFIKIPQVPDGSADITNYYAYKNMLDTFAQDGIHVRCFQHETFFEEDVYSLLIHLTKDCHTGLHIKGKCYNTQYINMLCKMDGVGAVKTHKLMMIAPNLERLVELAHYEGVFEKIIGTINGKKLRAFITEQSHVKECMINYRNLFCNGADSTISMKIDDSIKDSKESPESLIIQSDSILSESSSHQGTENKQIPPNNDMVRSSLTVPGDSGSPTKETAASLSSPSGNIITTKPLLPDGTDQQGKITPHPADLLGQNTAQHHEITPTYHGVKIPAAPHNTIHSLEDVITDFCFDEPKSDLEIISNCQYRGFKLPEIHKAMITLSKTKMEKYKQGDKTMFAYCGIHGVRAMPEMDIGV